MFAYGVSNSGKSYTISGGQEGGMNDRGVLPRSIDVVFNSIKGMESDAKVSAWLDLVRIRELIPAAVHRHGGLGDDD